MPQTKRGTSGKGGKLAAYKAKRDFTKSPEPTGAGSSQLKKSQKKTGSFFCVQKHLASHLHYDFRLEHDGVLLSWAVPKGPSLNPADKRLAMRVEDHPLDYGEFEGVIPEGYGAGIVLLWDRGLWEPEPGFENVGRALAKGEVKFRLDGVKLKGSWVLVNTSRGSGDGRSWLLIKHRDEWAGPVDVAASFPMSVKSDGDFEDVLAQEKPDVWESHRPAKGGEAGEMLERIMERAKRLGPGRKNKRAASTGTRRKTAKRRGAGAGGPRRKTSSTRRRARA